VDCRLACAVCGHVRSDAQCRDGAYVDDVPCASGYHPWSNCAGDADEPVDIGFDHVCPIIHRPLVEPSAAADVVSGVIDQDADLAELLRQAVGNFINGGANRDVENQRVCLLAETARCKDNPTSFADKCRCDRAADAAGGAGHESHGPDLDPWFNAQFASPRFASGAARGFYIGCASRNFRTLAGIVAPAAKNASANQDRWPAEAGTRSIIVEPPTQQAAMTVTHSPTGFANCRSCAPLWCPPAGLANL